MCAGELTAATVGLRCRRVAAAERWGWQAAARFPGVSGVPEVPVDLLKSMHDRLIRPNKLRMSNIVLTAETHADLLRGADLPREVAGS